MQIIKKSSSGTHPLPLDAVLLSERRVFLTDSITTKSVQSVIQQLLFLESEDSSAPIKLVINSPGGEVRAGLALYDQIKGMEVPIEMYCFELAASMAAVILAGGEPGRRFILKHSEVMIHEPLLSSAAGGMYTSASSIQKTAESIMKTKRELNELLARDTGRSLEEIEKAVSYDHFMSAEEAVAFGICDAIVERI